MSDMESVVQGLRGGKPTFMELAYDEMALFVDVIGEARRYFPLAPVYKNRDDSHGDMLSGYHKLGTEYSQSPEVPDLNESFWFRASDAYTPEYHSKALHQALAAMSSTLEAYAKRLFALIEKQYGQSGAIKFSKNSWSQVNHYDLASTDRNVLQEPHDDGHLLTFVQADAPGLEYVINRGGHEFYVDMPPRLDGFYVMPGYTLQLLTGGEIRSGIHRVINYRKWARRHSYTFFANLDKETPLFVENESNRGVSAYEVCVNHPAKHGLKTL